MINTSNKDYMYVPEVCPKCGAPLIWKGEDLVCENENEYQLIYRFISVVGATDGVGSSLYNKFIEIFNLENIDQLVKFINKINLEKSKLYEIIDNTVSGSVTQNKCKLIINKLGESINPIDFLIGCNIKGLSWKTTESLIKQYPEYINDVILNKVNYDKLYNIGGIGYTTVETLKYYENRISNLAKCFTFLNYNDSQNDMNFSVAITGALSMKRSDFDKILKSHGISQSSNFKEIKYLITNNPDSGSSKNRKARENNVEIISEKDFVNKFLK